MYGDELPPALQPKHWDLTQRVFITLVALREPTVAWTPEQIRQVNDDTLKLADALWDRDYPETVQ